MGDQIRAEDWLPQGWKVEIRIRKSGKKDRYYIDPTNGYIFRSLKDIDRYLLTGKLGRHVTKTKPKDLDCSIVQLDIMTLPLKQVFSKKKESRNSNRMKKSSPDAQQQNPTENSSQKSSAKASKKEDTRAVNSKNTTKKKISRPYKGRSANTSKKREASPFFILDPDQCKEGGEASIPNLSEIIDSMQKEQEGHNTVYISAPAIGALLGGQLPQTRVKWDNNRQHKPQFSLTICQDYNPNLSSMVPTFLVENEALESENNINPDRDPTHDSDQRSRMVDDETERSKDREKLGICPLFGDLLTDPCIDFAIKTLTGTIPLGNETASDCYFHQPSP